MIASYKTGFALKSEFVAAPADSRAGASAKAAGSTGAPRPRFWSPRECARLQGFPWWFDLQPGNAKSRNPNRVYHQMGNAVSPVMVAAIGAAVVAALVVVPPAVAPTVSISMPGPA